MEVKPLIGKASLYDAATTRFSQVFCLWVVPFLRLLAKHTSYGDNDDEPRCSLEIEDLHRCAAEDGAERLYGRFDRNYKDCRREVKLAQKSKIHVTLKEKLTSLFALGKLLHEDNAFLWALIRTFRLEAAVPFVLLFLQDVVIKPVQPLLIGLIIRYFYQLSSEKPPPTSSSSESSENTPISTLYCLAATAGLCLSSLLLISAHHPSLQSAMRLSMRVKIVWSAIIYNKCLKLTPDSTSSAPPPPTPTSTPTTTNSGKPSSSTSSNSYNLSSLLNMMTNDVRRFDEFALMSHYLLIVPLQTALILALSWAYIGASCLATFAAFLLLAWSLSVVGRKLAQRRTASSLHTERRLKVLGEVLRYLRALKMYTLEGRFLEKVVALRREELRQLKVPLVFRSVILSFSMVSSRVIMYFSFLLYLLVLEDDSGSGKRKGFYPETVFVSVALFERLRYSLTWTLPLAISGLCDVAASCRRMGDFLEEVEKEEEEKEKILPKNGVKNGNSSSTTTTMKKKENRKGVFISNLCTRYRYQPQQAQHSAKSSPSTTEHRFQLANISFSVEAGESLSIIGPVGSGKSTLLLALLGEVALEDQDHKQVVMEVNGSVAYVSQELYTLSGATIRENVLFGRPLQADRYREVLELVSLTEDLAALPLGDQSIVGEHGYTLSGGQKARLNLARALYGDADVYLLDDPFSAVDAALGRRIYQRVIEGHLRGKAVLLATHQLQYVPACSRLLLLERGRQLAYGPFEELIKADGGKLAEFFNLTKYTGGGSTREKSSEVAEATDVEGEGELKMRVEEKLSTSNGHGPKKGGGEPQHHLQSPPKTTTSSTTTAAAVHPSYSIATYWRYLKHGSHGLGSISLVLLSATMAQASLYLCDHWLTLWNDLPSISRTTFFLVYSLLVVGIVACAILRSVTFYELCLAASERTHNRLARKVLHASIGAFDYLPVGRMLSLFTRDVGILDETLPSALFELNLAFSQVLSIVCVILFLNPYLSTVTLIYMYLLYRARHLYSLPSHVVRNFEVQARNRIFAQLSSTLHGLTTIRAYAAGPTFLRRFYALLDDHTATVFLQLSTSRLFCTAIDLLAIGYIVLILSFLFAFSDATNGALIGHCLSNVFSLIGVAQWALKRSIDSDLWIMSFTNLSLCEGLPQEEEEEEEDRRTEDLEMENQQQQQQQMMIEMENCSVYYEQKEKSSQGEDKKEKERSYVLRDVSLRVRPGEKIGICGRSGAGKSSLVNSLLRFNGHTGEIRLDGRRLEAYPLALLRQSVAIIPQYPVIFSGSIRENLTLFKEHGFTDEQLWAVLERVQLRAMVERSFKDGGLDAPISIDSQQMSLGEKQLICVARIMLQKEKEKTKRQLVILDEPTAAVDFHTDKLIQATIREVFAEHTVITIAHRLDSIIDCDRILVFDNGALVEDDTPRRLLERKHQQPLKVMSGEIGSSSSSSHFAQLVKQTGPKMAARLEASASATRQSSSSTLGEP